MSNLRKIYEYVWKLSYEVGLIVLLRLRISNISNGRRLIGVKSVKILRNNKRNLSIMKNLFKIAAGIFGGIAIILSLGGLTKSATKNEESREQSEPVEDEHIPDDIFDGNNNLKPEEQNSEIRQSDTRERYRENFRALQEGLVKVSNMLGHLSTIVDCIMKMFRQDPCVKVTPTTYIY